MRQQSPSRHPLSSLPRGLVALLAGAGLVLVALPAAPAWAAQNQAHLDRQVLKAMQTGQSIHVIVVARGDLTVLWANLRRTGLKDPLRVPIAPGLPAKPPPPPSAPSRLTPTPG